ncbi:hypothetical protein C8R43DRAFT_1230706 [Mycena crocata]|nr:hypothetical protein C8R43DRAFT_1230706 [Mycena crocata]
MGMHCPTSIYDSVVFETDPLASLFLARELDASLRGCKDKVERTLVDAVQNAEGVEQTFAIETWWSLVAFPGDGDTFRADAANSGIFIHFFWLLYQSCKGMEQLPAKDSPQRHSMENDACNFLNKTLGILRSKRIHRGDPSTTVHPSMREARKDSIIDVVGEPQCKRIKLLVNNNVRRKRLSRTTTTRVQNPESRGSRRHPNQLPLLEIREAHSVATPSAQGWARAYYGSPDQTTFCVQPDGLASMFDESHRTLIIPRLDAKMPHSPTSEPEYQYQYGWPTSHGGYPPIWSATRQEMCESSNFFRSYQGGVYQHAGVVKGYMLGAFCRDRFEHGGKLIISHGGGGRVQDSKGKLQPTPVDQEQAAISVRALMRNYEEGTPLVLLVHDKYPLFPLNLSEKGIHLAVLAEYQQVDGARVRRYMFAFKLCDCNGQDDPWWHTKHNYEWTPGYSILSGPVPFLHRAQCKNCNQTSPQIYIQNWACLNKNCSLFWQSNGELLLRELDYNPEFLALRDLPKFPADFDTSLTPQNPTLAPVDGCTTSDEYMRGWYCNDCGRVSSRFAYEKFECANCGKEHPLVGKVHAADSLQKPIEIPSGFNCRDYILHAKDITVSSAEYIAGAASGVCHTFLMPLNRGKIYLIRGGGKLNGEADTILEDYQTKALDGTLPFRRWTLRKHSGRSEM